MVLQKVLEQGTMQKLNEMKEKLESVKTENELTSLESEILGGVVDQKLSSEEKKIEEEKQQEFASTLHEELEKTDEKKDKFLLILDKILQYDQNNKIKYNR
jgi:regulator of replication initiation timing